MIGPAEIEEMMAEFQDMIAWTGAGDRQDLAWPVFVVDHHLDTADRRLIGSYERWIETNSKAGRQR